MTWSKFQLAIFAYATSFVNVIVRALPGVGKSTTLAEFVNRAPEGDAVALFAFGNKAAADLATKVTRPGASVSTINAAGARIVRMKMTPRGDPDKGREARLTQKILGTDAPRDMVKLVAELANHGKAALPGYLTRGRLAAEGKAAKAAGNIALADKLRIDWQQAPQLEMEALAEEFEVAPDPHWAMVGWDAARVAKVALQVMELSRNAHNLDPAHPHYDNTISFNDQVYLPVVNNWIVPCYDRVLLDEAQDTNPVGMVFVRRLLKAGGQFMVCGDENQALFAFRGADTQSMTKLKASMGANVVELTLPVTYRCAQSIVREAQKYIPEYVAHDSNPEGEVRTVRYASVVDLVGPGDFILSRTNAPLTKVCMKLLLAGKRAKVEGRKVGEKLAELVTKLSGKVNSIPELLAKLAAWEMRESERAHKSLKNEDKLAAKLDSIEDTAECIRALTEGVAGVAALKVRIDELFTDNAAASPQVVCMTVHKSKGLETDRVFVLQDTLAIRISKKMAKTDTSSKAAKRAETERCIRVVAATRPKTSLVYVVGLEDSAGVAAPASKHEAAVAAAGVTTGETLEAVAAAITATRQLMEKDESPELKEALASLEAKHTRLTQAKA